MFAIAFFVDRRNSGEIVLVPDVGSSGIWKFRMHPSGTLIRSGTPDVNGLLDLKVRDSTVLGSVKIQRYVKGRRITTVSSVIGGFIHGDAIQFNLVDIPIEGLEEMTRPPRETWIKYSGTLFASKDGRQIMKGKAKFVERKRAETGSIDTIQIEIGDWEARKDNIVGVRFN